MRVFLVRPQNYELRMEQFSLLWKYSLFIWNNIDYEETTEQCNLANEDPLGLWHKRLGHNNVEDVYKLTDHAVGLKLSESDLTNCEKCQLKKSKKLPVPKDSGTRACEVLEIVHTDILGPVQPEAVDGHISCCLCCLSNLSLKIPLTPISCFF